MAGSDDAGIGKACFMSDIVVPLDDCDFMSCFGKKIGGADADDAPADNYDLLCHLFNLSLGVWTGALRDAAASDDAAGLCPQARKRACMNKQVCYAIAVQNVLKDKAAIRRVLPIAK